MAITDEPGLHDVADRALRQSLETPANLRALLSQAVPELAPHFVCEERRVVPRDFLMDDWRGREADLLLEVPYRTGEATTETVLVCVLIEHRSEPDPRMPLRTLTYAVLYWDRQWRRWEEMPAPRPAFSLRPVMPIVFHTGPSPWRNNRTLADLLSGPDTIRSFAPQWAPVFWNLAEQTPQELLDATDGWVQMLAVIWAEGATAEDFAAVYQRVLQRLQTMPEADRYRWGELMRIVLTWMWWRRNQTERPTLEAATVASIQETSRRQEMHTMGRTIAQAYIDEGREQGRQQGLQEGRQEGRQEVLPSLRLAVVEFATLRFGEPAAEVRAQIDQIADLDRLTCLIQQVRAVGSWAELLGQQPSA